MTIKLSRLKKQEGKLSAEQLGIQAAFMATKNLIWFSISRLVVNMFGHSQGSRIFHTCYSVYIASFIIFEWDARRRQGKGRPGQGRAAPPPEEEEWVRREWRGRGEKGRKELGGGDSSHVTSTNGGGGEGGRRPSSSPPSLPP